MRAADCVVDIGPGAGEHGGKLVEIGTAETLMQNPDSVTGAYLSGRIKIPVPTERKQPTGWLKIRGAAENNLKQVNVDIPLGVMTSVTGVSGSGKSSLINEVLYKTLARDLNRARTIRQRIQAFLTRSEIFLPRLQMRRQEVTRRDVSVLTSRADAVRHAAVTESSRSRCISWQMSMFHVKCARVNVITEKRWK